MSDTAIAVVTIYGIIAVLFLYIFGDIRARWFVSLFVGLTWPMWIMMLIISYMDQALDRWDRRTRR